MEELEFSRCNTYGINLLITILDTSLYTIEEGILKFGFTCNGEYASRDEIRNNGAERMM